MKVQSWLSACSSTASGDATASCPIGTRTHPPTSLTSEASSGCSDIQTQSSSSTSNTSLQSNPSLLTLPSVPSLQKLTLSPENPAANSPATAIFLASIKADGGAHVNFISVHDNLLYAALGNEIDVYETVNNTLFDTFKVSTGSVKSIAFRDGKVFTAHQDCKIRVWKLNDQKQHKLVATLPTLEDRLRRFILPQNYVRVRRHKKKLWIEHHDAVSGLVTSENENFVLSISWDKSLKIWQPRNLRCFESINEAHDDAINAVAISNDGLIYTGSADKRIKVWKKEGRNFATIATLEKHKSAVNALALDHDGSVLFSGSCDRSILVWEREGSANHMAVTGALRGHAKAILCLINVQDLLLSGSSDRTVRIWQRGVDGRYCCLTVLDGHQTPVRSLAVEKGGGGVTVFSGSFDGVIKMWRVEVTSVKD